MNILWLPHAPLERGRTRSDHLIERLSRRHRVTVASFLIHERRSQWRHLTDLFTHRSRQGKLYDELAVLRIPKAIGLNGWLLNRAIRYELRRRRYDALVVAPAPYLTGYLDYSALHQKVPIICDYLDGIDWSQQPEDSIFERLYVESADAVMCVSHPLLRQASSVNPKSYYVPNGVELARFRAFRSSHTASECKARLGINADTFVVSIIGMTCSSRLYFVDATLALARKGRKIMLLLVGDSPLLDEVHRRAAGIPTVVRAVGAVPYTDILPYFMATDLGLYPVEDHPYYQFASPLKIFEYLAMGKAVVVAPRLLEVARIASPRVSFCGADAKSLADSIEHHMDAPVLEISTELNDYDWDTIAQRVEAILLAVLNARHRSTEPLAKAEGAGCAL